MLGRRYEIAKLQSDFYRDQFHKILRWLLVTSVIIIALAVAIGYFILFQPAPAYYASTTEGKILSMPSGNALKTVN